MTPSSEKTDILIVTVTDVERDAVYNCFKAETGKSGIQKDAYMDLGFLGGSRVWMVVSGMGSSGSGGSTLTIKTAIDEKSPLVVIAVGIAFGNKDKEQQIGDILVSEIIVPYENQRIGAESIIPRGPRLPATPRLLQIAKMAELEWKQGGNVPIHFGPILSGSKLVDNLEFRNHLFELAPEAIGGEMEGSGLSDVAYLEKRDWILIKSICDWADGNKGEDKKKRQALAAENAARFTLFMLRKGILELRTYATDYAVTKLDVESDAEVDREFLQISNQKIQDHLRRAEYKLATDAGLVVSKRIGDQFEHDDLEAELLFGDFRVSYALASIYSDGLSEFLGGNSYWLKRVKERLEKRKSFYLENNKVLRRFHLILGRVYNYLGYGYWMDRGHYEAALREFNKALEHFIAGEWSQEKATVYDNLARVYAQIGFRTHAEALCRHGLKLREEIYKNEPDNIENQYRRALSLNSSAVIHLIFGQSFRAYLESEKALRIFEKCVKEKGKRGIGLALITKGQSARMLAGQASFAIDTSLFEEYLQKAFYDFREAEKIFKEVDEEIRLIQVYNELGCAYRENYLLHNKTENEKALQDEQSAKRYFDKILSSSENEEKYPVAYVDTCHDLAQFIYFTSERNGLSEERKKAVIENLDRAEKIIPKEYKIPGKIDQFESPVEECFEDYWQNLGKIYSLRGDIEFRGVPVLSDADNSLRAIRREKIEKAFWYYTMAAGYFSRYLERPISNENAFYPGGTQRLEAHFNFTQSLYERMSNLNNSDLTFLHNKMYNNEFNLPSSWLERFFKQSFDLLLRK
jgi:nucleoside phosphorylase